MKYFKLFILSLLLLTFFQCSSPDEEKVLLCLGDSLTESSYGNYPANLDKMFKKRETGIRAISLGRPGDTSGEYLNFFSKSGVLEKYNPGFIVLMLGTNDVRVDYDNTPTPEYKKNMLEIIDIIREYEKKEGKDIKIFIATIPPIFTPDLETFTKSSALRIEEEILPAIKEIAFERELIIINIHSMFLRNKDLLPGIHPTPGGYFKMARLVFVKLLRDIQDSCIPCV